MAQSGNDDCSIYLSYSLPRLITTPIKYCITAYFWELYIKEFGWTFSEYSKLYWLYVFTQIISYISLGLLFYYIIDIRKSSEDNKTKLHTTKWIEIASLILLSVTFFLLILLPICWYILKLPVRTIIWNLLCRARTTARNYMTPYERYPFEKAERDKRIRIIRSMLPDLLNPLPRSSPSPNSELEQLLNLTPKPDHTIQPIQVIGTLPSPSIPFWPRFWHCLCIPFKIIWNLLCRGRTTARNYLTPYESYPAENAERQKRLRIIRSMFPELANPLPNAAPNPQPEPSTNPIPVINTLPKPSLLSRMRSLFKPKSKLRSPYDFPFSPVEFGGVPDLTATWTMVWYKSPDPGVPEIEYKPSLRERLNYFRNRGSYNVAKYDPPVPEMYIPPEPEPSPIPSTSKFTPTSPPPPIPPIKREHLPEPKSIPKPNQGPIPYITPCPAPVDNIPEPEPIPELDPIPGPKLNIDGIPYITPDTPTPLLQGVPIAEPISKVMSPPTIEPEPPPLHLNIPLRNNRAIKAYPNNPESPFRPIELVLRLIVSKRFILYMIIALHSIGTSSYELCNRALTTYIYPYKEGGGKDTNEQSRNDINTISVGFFTGISFLVNFLFSLVKLFTHSETAFTRTLVTVSIFFLFGQVPVLYYFHEKMSRDDTAYPLDDLQCPQLADYLKLISLTTFHATTLFWVFMTAPLTNYVPLNIAGRRITVMTFGISIIVVGFPVMPWLHIGATTFIRDTCGFLFNYGDGQIILVAACIIGQGAIYYLFDHHEYWWNISSIPQFFILIITGIANTILLVHTYVMFDNVVKKNNITQLKWLIIGIFYAIVSLVVYSAIYINFNSYDNDGIVKGTRNLYERNFYYSFPGAYKLITFIFQLANVAAFAVYYLVHSCDVYKRRLEERKMIILEINQANYTAHVANTIAKSALMSADDANQVASEAVGIAKDTESIAMSAHMTATKANETAKEAKKEAAEARIIATYALDEASYARNVASYALEVSSSALEAAIYALKIAVWAHTVATGALEFSSSAKNLAAYALNFASTALNLASYAHRDANIAKSQAAEAMSDAKFAKTVASSAKNLAADAQAYATSAKTFAEHALTFAANAKRDSTDAQINAENAKNVALNARIIAINAEKDAAWAKGFANEAKGHAIQAKSQAVEAQTDAAWALSFASTALDTAEQTKRDLEKTKKKVTETETKASQAKETADEVKRALEASEKMGEAISKVERKKIQSLANGFITSSNLFQKRTQEFDYAATSVLNTRGINSEVQGVLTYFSQAANYFKKAVDTLTRANDGAAQKFLDFTDELQKNLTCNTPNTSLMPILYGLVTRVEKLQDAVNDFKNKADIFGDARTPTAKQFHTMATKFSRTGRAFNSFAQSLSNTAEYFVEFANALPQNRGCGQLKNKARQFKEVAHTFSNEARSFENTSASFSGESSKITIQGDLKSIQKHFKTTPTGTQLPLKFKDAIDALHQSIKSVVI